jgi:hypothetical protein
LLNSHQYIPPSTTGSEEHKTNGYEPNNALKSENKQAIDVGKMDNLFFQKRKKS